jgi:zinc/manganese transport system permease protein
MMSQLLEMLGFPFLACLMLGGILAYCGMHVLKREIIFIDITLAQVAAVGAIIAQLAFGAHPETWPSYTASLVCVLVLAAFCAVLRKGTIRIPIEAVIGVSYAIAAAAAIFLISLAPTEIHAEEMLAGSLLWIGSSDLITGFVVFAATGFCFCVLHRPLLQISESSRDGLVSGWKVARWDFVFYVLVGVVITTAVRLAGVIVVFAFLIIPATVSALFASGWATRMLIAWTVATMASIGGLLFAYYLDFSLGPAIALFMGILLVTAAVGKKLQLFGMLKALP